MARRQFTREFKLEAVLLGEVLGVSVVRVARDLEVGDGILPCLWRSPARFFWVGADD
jgi:transposase-like protein